MIFRSGQTTDYQFEIFKKFSSHDAYPEAEKWLGMLRSIDDVIQAEITGDLRRGKSTVGSIEIAAAAQNSESVITSVLGLEGYMDVEEATPDTLRLLLTSGIQLIIRFSKLIQFGSLLQFTTGSPAHNELLENRGESLNLSYQSGRLEKNGALVEFETEGSLYSALGLPLIPPELREGENELETPHSLNTSHLIAQTDIKSDLHVHTDFSDGKDSVEEMVCGALIRNLSAIAITDHSPSMLYRRYSDDSYLLEQHEVIDQLRKKYSTHITILKGIEADILPNGAIDLSAAMLKKMDIVVASLHVELDQPREEITARLIRAIENPFVDIIGHPGGRLYPMADITDLDWDKIFRAAAYNQVALEINSHKSHPLFEDEKVRQAVALGVPIALDSDSHSTAMLDQSRFGISIARRAGLSSDQVINTWSPNHLQLWLKAHRKSTAAER
ncbi:MAG: PHP domain-containing protein [Pelolinea sp.]|nr:PHP domain-containing protein [Pelolinea sp.]